MLSPDTSSDLKENSAPQAEFSLLHSSSEMVFCFWTDFYQVLQKDELPEHFLSPAIYMNYAVDNESK